MSVRSNTAVAVRLRLSPAQLRLIWPGLARISGGLRLWQATGKLPAGNLEPDLPTRSAGRPDEELVNLVIRLADALQTPLQSGRRLRLEAVGIAALIWATRVTLRLVRHGRVRRWLHDHGFRARKLVCCLERYRKRAKRLAVAVSAEDYRTRVARWQQLVRWTRRYFLKFDSHSHFPVLMRRRYYQSQVDKLMEAGRQGARNRGLEPPPDCYVRKAVRLAIRYVRRGRTDFTLRQLLEHPPLAERHVGEILLRWCRRNNIQLQATESWLPE